MTVLVVSDSHHTLSGIYQAIDKHHPDHVIHLGDLMRDAQKVADVYPTLPICIVPGNCDGWTDEPVKKQITLAGKSILMSHGHLWGVKRGYDAAIADARAVGADILLFGHTHVAYCQQLEDGLWVMNPGAASSSYGLIQLDGSDIQCSLYRL